MLGKDLDATLRELAHDGAVVLASGDPGFFGIVRALSALTDDLDVHPAPSVRRARVRAARRPVGRRARRLRPRPRPARGDQRRAAPPEGRDPHPARQHRADRRRASRRRNPVVAEALGTPDERLATEPPFNDPNVVIVHEPTAGRATVWPPRTPTRWALPEDAFEHRAGMITKAEVRALALAALGPGTGDHIWDVGCGSGAVGIECARLGAAVTAIDQDPDAIALATRNAAAHGVPARHRRSAPRPSRCAISASPTPSSSAAAAPPSSTRRRGRAARWSSRSP